MATAGLVSQIGIGVLILLLFVTVANADCGPCVGDMPISATGGHYGPMNGCFCTTPPSYQGCQYEYDAVSWLIGPQSRGNHINKGTEPWPEVAYTHIVCTCSADNWPYGYTQVTQSCDDWVQYCDVTICQACSGTG